MRKALLLLLSAFFFNSLLAGSPPEFRFSRLGMLQGLSSNEVLDVFTDSRGFTWIGTRDGLNCFDGETFRVFRHRRDDPASIPHSTVYSICEERSGMLLIGTAEGLARFNPWNGKSVVLQCSDPDNPHPRCSSVRVDHNGNAWAWSLETLYRLNPVSGRLDRLYACDFKDGRPDRIAGFYEDKKGGYWICSYDGLYRYDPVKNTGTRYRPGGEPFLLTSLYEDHEGRFWCGSWGMGVLRFFPETGTFESTPWSPSPAIRSAENIVQNFCETVSPDGQILLWAGTNNGLALIETTGSRLLPEQIRFFHTDPANPESISSDNIGRLSVNSDNQLWIATSEGISVLLPGIQVFQPFAREVRGTVTHLVPDGENLFACTWYGDGLQLVGKTGRRLHVWKRVPENSPGIDNMQISDVLRASDSTIWVATFGGLSHGDRYGRRFEQFLPDTNDPGSIVSAHITCLAEDDSGNIWCGTYGKGISVYLAHEKRFITYGDDGQGNNTLPHRLVWEIIKRRNGEIWFGTNDGIAIFDGRAGRPVPMRSIIIGADTFTIGICSTIFEDSRAQLWFGTPNGLFCRDTTGAFHWYGQENGLAGNDIMGISEDEAGRIWISTLSGLSELDPASGSIRNFGPGSGLPTVQLSGDIIRFDHELVIGLNNRFIAFNPGQLEKNTTLPRIFITRIVSGTTDLQLENDPSGYSARSFGWKDDLISFDFVAPAFRGEPAARYQYRLVGAAENWVNSGTRHFASYGGLAPGSYTFEVRASLNKGPWSAPAKFSFVIRPPFWKTWWFLSTTTVLSLLLVILVVRREATRKMREQLLVLEKQQAIHQERNRISRDMHDDLGSGLTKIAILSEVVKQKIHQPAEAQKQIDTISDSARGLVDNLNEIIWALNPENDNFHNLAAYTREYADKYLEPFSIRLECEIPDTLSSIRLSEEKRRFLFLVVKETLHNIVRHAAATVVKLRFESQDGKLRITVEDNGRGFGISESRPLGNGLKNMRRRMESIGGTFAIRSAPGEGTRTEIAVDAA